MDEKQKAKVRATPSNSANVSRVATPLPTPSAQS